MNQTLEKGTIVQWKIQERGTLVKNGIYKGKGLEQRFIA